MKQREPSPRETAGGGVRVEMGMIGGDAMLLYVSGAELDRRNMDGQRLKLGDTLRLTREACERENIPWEELREVAVYADQNGATLLLRLKERERQSVFFDSLAELLDGLAALPEPMAGEMGFWQGRYVLTTSAPGAAGVLSEFGQTATRWEQRQAERAGHLVLDEIGIRKLWAGLRS